MSRTRPALTALLLACLSALSGCAFDGEACTSDSGDPDWISLLIDHAEAPGAYEYVLETGQGSNVCTFTAPLGGATPSCSLQGPAAEVESDGDGVVRITATQGGGATFQATRDDTLLFQGELGPGEWATETGEKGCARNPTETVLVQF